MTFLFVSPDFKQCLAELTRLSEKNIKDNTNSEVEALFFEHIRFNNLFKGDLQNEFDDLVKCSKDPFNYLEMMKNLTSDSDKAKIIVSSSLIYLYLKEYLFRKGNKVDSKIQLEINTFHQNVKSILGHIDSEPYMIKYADTLLAFDILQEVFKSSEFQGLANISKSLDEIKEYCDLWNNNLDSREKSVLELEKRLEKNKQTYDFVLLNAGFKSLYDQKQKSFTIQKRVNFLWIFLVIALPIVNLYIGKYLTQLQQYNWLNGLALVLPVITLILLCLYFYKIGLQEKRSIQSQMMQLELRMALCQFIHNYAEDSEKLHAKNKPGFKKLENIIFSPLVSSDDKIPTTFDGMEQLAKLVSEFRKH